MRLGKRSQQAEINTKRLVEDSRLEVRAECVLTLQRTWFLCGDAA